MAAPEQVLRVSFASAAAFREEYVSNLANGGVFVATDQVLELRTPARVELWLEFRGTMVPLDGEVVHRIPLEMAQAGATPGVAVQFYASVRELRDLLEPMVIDSGDGILQPEPNAEELGRRGARRSRARVTARVEGGGAAVVGYTRNLSRSGVLVAVPDRSVPVGEKVRLTLEHPTTGDTMEIGGSVARLIETAGEGAALGIAFDTPDDAVVSFLEDVQSTEHARGLGGISGSIAELGSQGLLQMLGHTTPAGTLTLRCGQEEGLVGFDDGLLRYARLGSCTGMKALVRLLSWSEGSFEFHARLDAIEASAEAPLPLEAALLDAVRRIDESARVDTSRFPPETSPYAGPGVDAPGEAPSKIEAAILDLVQAGFTVGRMVDVIPEPDLEIYRALNSLLERDAILIPA